MQRWIYYDYMGNYNPVCEDAGEIARVRANWPRARDSHGMIDVVTADGMEFHGDIKRIVLETGGIHPFSPAIGGAEYEFRDLPDGIRHGDELEVRPGLVWIGGDGGMLVPICTDPRILYMAHRGWELLDKGENLEEAEIRQWERDIPTREAALRWLLDNGKKTDCIPHGSMERILQRQARV